MNVEVLGNDAAAARRGAQFMAEQVMRAVAERGLATAALSGGKTPGIMLRYFAEMDLPWQHVDFWQVDERVAPPGSDSRNLTMLEHSLALRIRSSGARLHAMPVEAPDLASAAAGYGELLRTNCGASPVFDVVHLGLGRDGHTASLFLDDAALDVGDADVAVTGTHQGFVRMTLTLPILNRARRILWLVTGQDKTSILPRLFRSDPSIPAGRVRADRALVLADVEAASSLRFPETVDDL